MQELLAAHISKHINLSTAEFSLVEANFQPRKFRKRQYILQEADICRYETFIVRGCTRSYETNAKGQEHILQFGLEGWWVGNLYSFLSGNPSGYHIECLEECEVLQISRPDLENLYLEVPAMERYFRILVQNAFIALQDRILNTLSKPAAEQYIEFIEKYPHIEQRVPDHMVASYLGITAQSLSRIRRQLAGG